jgi:hypothetical protein
MQTINFKPIKINNTDVQTVEDYILVKNFSDQNKLIETGLKALLKDAIKYQCKKDVELEIDLKFSNSQIVVEARFEVEGDLDLAQGEEGCFDAVQLLHNYLFDAQEKVFRPLEQQQFDKIKDAIALNLFPCNLKKLNEKVTAALDVLEVIGVLNYDDKEIEQHLIVDFDYKQKHGPGKEIKKLQAQILSIDINRKNQFSFRPLDSKTTYKMQTDMVTIQYMIKWFSEHFPHDFYAELEFKCDNHLKADYYNCELIKITLELLNEGKQMGINYSSSEKD